MNYFQNCNSLDELKAEYRRLSKKHHPDLGGDTATMQEINAEYTARFEVLKTAHNTGADEYHQTTEAPQEFIDIINALIKMKGITVELCGSWLWISGDTRPHKEELKAAGCRWSQNKKMWYWRHPESARPYYRGKHSIDEIRTKYGSQVFNGGEETTGYAKIGATA